MRKGAAMLLQALGRAAEEGALRRLDAALAVGLRQIDPAADARVLLAAALLSHADGQGHVCLPLPDPGASAAEAAASLQRWTSPALRPLLPRWLQASGWTDEDADPCDAAVAALRSSVLVQTVPADAVADAATGAAAEAALGAPAPGPRRPLVLDGRRLYLHRHWRDECRLAAALRDRATAGVPQMQTQPVRAVLAALFPAMGPAVGGPTWHGDPQAAACALALRSRVSLVTGGPGTGKTYTAARLLVLAAALAPADQPLRVALAAPTGKAAARLRQSIATALDGLAAQGGDAAAWASALAPRLPPARTLHALLGARPDTRRLRHGPGHPLPVDLLLVDEASMVHLDGMARLLDALAPETRLVLLGDKDQLASVEAGAVLADLCADAVPGPADADSAAYLQSCFRPTGPTGPTEALPPAGADFPARAPDGPTHPPHPPRHVLARHTTVLARSRRFDGPIAALARAVNAGDAATALQTLREGGLGVLKWLAPARREALLALAVPEGMRGDATDGDPANSDPTAAGGYLPMLEALRALLPPAGAAPLAAALGSNAHEASVALLQAFDRFRVLCAVQEGPWGVRAINAAIEQALARAGLIDPRSPWYPGRPVMVTRNDAAAGVFNGDIGLVLPPAAPGAPARVAFAEGGSARWVSASRLPEVQTAYAMTVHKAQGSEFGHTVLVLPPEASPVLTRELVYTGITRARERFTLVTPQPGVLAPALAQRTRRASGLAERLRVGN